MLILYLLCSLKVDKYCTIELSHKGEHFLSRLFETHDKDKDDCLSPVELKSLFSMCTEDPPLLGKCIYNTNHKVINIFKIFNYLSFYLIDFYITLLGMDNIARMAIFLVLLYSD